MSLESDLRAALLAVAPVTNVYAPEGSDRSAWRAGFTDAVTDDQRAAAENVLATWSPAVPPRTATGKQLRYALSDLGVRAAWDKAVAASKQAVQDYWTTNGSDAVPEDNPKIAKLVGAVNAANGTASSGTTPAPAPLTVAALFDKAVNE